MLGRAGAGRARPAAGCGDRWSELPTAGRSSHGPALGRIDDGVLAWKGAGGDERLWWSWDGFRAQQVVRAGYTTSDTPAFVGINFGER